MSWWKRFAGRRRFEQQLDAELQYHYERLVADQMRQGVSEKEARRNARLQFGGAAQLKEECRDERGLGWVESSWNDVRFAARSLRRNPAFTLLVTAVLALGIGANTAIFSVMNAVLLRPLDYPESDRLYWVSGMTANGRSTQIVAAAFEAIRERSETLESATLTRMRPFAILGEQGAEAILGQALAGDGLKVFATPPLVGRLFNPDATHEVVLSHRLWMRRFQGDREIVGRSITLNGEAHTVVGVMPAGFETYRVFELWQPWHFNAGELAERGPYGFGMLARRKASVSPDQAKTEVAAISRSFANEPGTEMEGWTAALTQLKESQVGRHRSVLWMLFGAVGFVLLIACLNVASVMLARTLERSKEVTLRLALGAPRLRVARLFLAESLLLSIAGGLGGLFLAWGGTRAILSLASAGPILPRIDSTGVDATVLLFALAVSVLTGITFGLWPAWRASRLNLHDGLKAGGRGLTASRSTQFARGAAVALQVGLCLVLLSGAGLLLRSFVNLVQTDPGFEPEGVLTARIPAGSGGKENEVRFAAGYARILESANAIPGVETAALSTTLPMGPARATMTLTPEGHEPAKTSESSLVAEYHSVSPHYFEAMGIPLLQGRAFTEQDTEEAPGVAILNDHAAHKYWPGENPVGKRIATSFDDGKPIWLTVVGIAGGVRMADLKSEPTEELYRPYKQHIFGAFGSSLVLRTKGDPLALVDPLRQLLREEFPTQPVADVETMTHWVERSVARPRFDMTLLGVFALIALTVAVVGVYGLIAYGVRQRRREIGVRMAMGATAGDVARMVVRQGFRVLAPGLLLGTAGALALTRLLAAQLYGVEPHDPLTLAAAGCLLLGTGLLACWGPASRAAKINPRSILLDD